MFPVGIDLGTTFSAVAKWENTKKKIGSTEYVLPLETRQTLPSKVYVEKNDDDSVTFIVGTPALKKGAQRPEFFIRDTKRMMDKADFTYHMHGSEFSPSNISAEILKNLLKVVEDIEGPDRFIPLGVVVTVPYYFKEDQNARTRQAAYKAIKDRFEVRCKAQNLQAEKLFIDLLPEPIAAGLDYAFNQVSESRGTGLNGEKFLVFDLGGGTFDLTIFSLRLEQNLIEFEVLAIDGDAKLGGEDFEESYQKWILQTANLDLSDLSEKNKAVFDFAVRAEVTSTKEALSQGKESDFYVQFGGKLIDLKVTRRDLELCLTGDFDSTGKERRFYDEIESKINAVLHTANLNRNQITSVLMIGGSSKIPLFRQLVIDYFGADKIRNAENMDLAVARGAAIYAAFRLDQELVQQGKQAQHLILWKEIVVKERTAHSLGIELAGGRFHMMIPGNSLVPSSRVQQFSPSSLNEDRSQAKIDSIRVLQGTPKNFSVVGEINIPNIFTHGRTNNQIPITVRLIAEASQVRVEVFVPKGNADGSDYVMSGELSFTDHQ